jgi:hypothetical protein
LLFCLVERHAQGNDAVDDGGSVGPFDPPSSAPVACDRVGCVLAQFRVVGEGEPLLDDRLIRPVAGGHHLGVGLREADARRRL